MIGASTEKQMLVKKKLLCYNTTIFALEKRIGGTKMLTALSVVLALLGLGLVVIILMQSNRAAGLGAVGAASNDTYWSKNKANSAEGALEKYTKIGIGLFILLALILNFVK